jgi:hypothetical protein
MKFLEWKSVSHSAVISESDWSKASAEFRDSIKLKRWKNKPLTLAMQLYKKYFQDWPEYLKFPIIGAIKQQKDFDGMVKQYNEYVIKQESK